MADIKIRVEGRKATNLTPEVKLVTWNEGYEAEFEFDDSWKASELKTALFITKGQTIRKPFTGNKCEVPMLVGVEILRVGVESNDILGLKTTVAAVVECELSARDLSGEEVEAPTPSVYDELIELINAGMVKGERGNGIFFLNFDGFDFEVGEVYGGSFQDFVETSGITVNVGDLILTDNNFVLEVIKASEEEFEVECVSQIKGESGEGGGASNLKNGTGKGSLQQVADGVESGFDFTNKNATATAKDPSLTGILPYGAVGNYSSAFGGKSLAKGKRSHAEGTTTVAQGNYSHAEGNNSVTLGANSHAEGKQTTTYGENAHAEGFDTFAEGYISHSEGYKTHAQGSVSHAEGQGTHAIGDQSHAEGNGSIAEGHYSHAEGYGTHAKGKASHASGEGTIAEGDYQTVVGRFNQPIEYVYLNETTTAYVLFIVGNGKGNPDKARSIAFSVLDNGEVVSGYKDRPSFDESLINLAQFYDLLPEETTTNLKNGNGANSVQSESSIADYEYDFAFGKGLRTTNECQTVFGKYNSYSDEDWQHPRALFVIGNGTSNSSRSNAFEVKEDGTAYVGGKKLATTDEIGDIEAVLDSVISLQNSLIGGNV